MTARRTRGGRQSLRGGNGKATERQMYPAVLESEHVRRKTQRT
jgi:hypothetical protein